MPDRYPNGKPRGAAKRKVVEQDRFDQHGRTVEQVDIEVIIPPGSDTVFLYVDGQRLQKAYALSRDAWRYLTEIQ